MFRQFSTRCRSGIIAFVISLLAVALLAGSLVSSQQSLARAASPGAVVPLAGSAPALVAHSRLLRPLASGQALAISLGLRLRNAAALQSYLAAIDDPRSLNYHHYLTAAQIADAFSPSPAAYAAAQAYLKQVGFTITRVYSHRLLIDARGTVGMIENAFHVQLNNYSAPGGQNYYANATPALLPPSLVNIIVGINGLNNIVRLHHPPLPQRQPASTGANTASPCLAHNTGYYTPDQLASAYNLNGLYNEGYHGEGQTVALVEFSTYTQPDFSAYAACYGHSHTPVYPVIIDGGPPPPLPGQTDSGVLEVELDAELVLSTAPALGKLDIYEAPNTIQGLNDEWAQIVQDDPPVVSTSWGDCESDMAQNAPGELAQENQYFILAAAQGQTIFAASGDTGCTDCLNTSGVTTLNVDDPASQPYIVGAGGTTLTINQNGSYSGDTVWNNSYGASGGGISTAWQENASFLSVPGVQNSYSTSGGCNASQGQICREVPDVSLNADPNTGYPIYCTDPAGGCNSATPWWVVGGTSAAAPMWAAMMALTNEKSVRSGSFNMGFVSPLLYQIAGNSTQYRSDFHDITQGNNDYGDYQNGLYPATAGYDLASGLGSYNAASLAADLVALNGQRATTPAATTWYFAEGSVGGGFQEYLTLQNPGVSQAASITIKYLLQNHTPATVTTYHTVAPGTRSTVNVNNDLGITRFAGHVSVAAIVSSSAPIVAERPMYFNYEGIQSGTDALGATSPQLTYYFPEANSTRTSSANYSTYITMLNPGAAPAAVTITYYTGICGASGESACLTETLNLGPMARGTASPTDVGLHQQVAIAISATQPIVAERPMYVSALITNAGGETTGAASELGAAQPGTDWLFAEGYTGTDFQEYLDLANFGSTTATTTIKLEYTNGDVQMLAVNVSPYSFKQVDVNQANAQPGTCSPSPCQVTSNVSAEVTSNTPIVADRLMYFHYGSSHISGVTEAVGAPAAANIYAFAEGYTGGQFTEYLTLQNPTGSSVTVVVTLFTQGGLVFAEQVVIAAFSRSTLNINSLLNPIGPDSVSLSVQALGTHAQIVAERPLYFNYFGDPGGTDIIGYTGS